LAVGALEAAIEHARAHLALVFTFKQRSAAAFVAPALLRLFGRAVEDHAISLNPVDVRATQRMMSAAAFRIGFGEDDAVGNRTVDCADMLVVTADDLHLLANLVEQPALLLATAAPLREVVIEARLVLAPIVVIIAVELVDLTPAPRMIVRIH